MQCRSADLPGYRRPELAKRKKEAASPLFSQANKTSKLQTELGTYHLQYDFQNPAPWLQSNSGDFEITIALKPQCVAKVPTDMATWPSRDELLDHFAKARSMRQSFE